MEVGDFVSLLVQDIDAKRGSAGAAILSPDGLVPAPFDIVIGHDSSELILVFLCHIIPLSTVLELDSRSNVAESWIRWKLNRLGIERDVFDDSLMHNLVLDDFVGFQEIPVTVSLKPLSIISGIFISWTLST